MKRRTIYVLAASAFAGIFIFLVFLPIPSVPGPPVPPRINVQLSGIDEVRGIDGDSSRSLDVSFAIENIGARWYYLRALEYQLFANNQSLGNSSISYETTSSPELKVESAIIEKDTFHLECAEHSQNNAQVFTSICNAVSPDENDVDELGVKWAANGTLMLEDANAFYVVDFQSEYQSR